MKSIPTGAYPVMWMIDSSQKEVEEFQLLLRADPDYISSTEIKYFKRLP